MFLLKALLLKTVIWMTYSLMMIAVSFADHGLMINARGKSMQGVWRETWQSVWRSGWTYAGLLVVFIFYVILLLA